jgi:hypothetical protein
MFARPEVQLNQHVSVQAPSNDLIPWLHKVIPSIEALVRSAPTNEEDKSEPATLGLESRSTAQVAG